VKVKVCATSPFAEPLSDAILISSNQRMKMAGGLSGAVHRLAGPGLRVHCDDLPPLPVGTAIVTPGFDSPFPWIIHAHPGNIFTHFAPWSCLMTTLLAALEAAESTQLRSVSMSAFGTGSAQIPTMAAANITMRALSEVVGAFKHLEQVKFCITDRLVHDTYLGAARVQNLVDHISSS
jgi:O-acetyl-ADP-ribose deacetylase (regulator of RNase III)